MTENTLHHEFWAVPDSYRRGFLGKYQTAAGVNYVRGEHGIVTIFETREEALRAASISMCRALDAAPKAKRSLAAKTFAVSRNGKSVRTISLPRS